MLFRIVAIVWMAIGVIDILNKSSDAIPASILGVLFYIAADIEDISRKLDKRG